MKTLLGRERERAFDSHRNESRSARRRRAKCSPLRTWLARGRSGGIRQLRTASMLSPIRHCKSKQPEGRQAGRKEGGKGITILECSAVQTPRKNEL